VHAFTDRNWHGKGGTPPFVDEVVGLVFKADRLLYHSTLGLRVIKKKKKSVLHWGGRHTRSQTIQGYLAHKKLPPPPSTTAGS